WDAANTTSAKLAEKLGYVFDKAYDTYFVDNSSNKRAVSQS
ncbi:TPA: GNAT family N-acetyltransferase, partial [Bacillus cereus]